MSVVVTSFCGLCVLLVLGKVLRTLVPLLQRLYLPASVIGGLLGLLCLNQPFCRIPQEWYAYWTDIPGFLINIVFAALFIGAKLPCELTVSHINRKHLCRSVLQHTICKSAG